MVEEPEEPSFKSIRITLSEEAIDRLDYIGKLAKFRSSSSSIEECIRATYDLIQEVFIIAGQKNAPIVQPTPQDCFGSLNRMIVRLSRFTGRVPATHAQKK